MTIDYYDIDIKETVGRDGTSWVCVYHLAQQGPYP